MNKSQKKWLKKRKKYLAQIKEVLNYEKSKSKNEILENVAIHLDEKYAELANNDINEEKINDILTSMGKPEDYLENPGSITLTKLRKRKIRQWIFRTIGAIFALLIIYVVTILSIRGAISNPKVVSTYPELLANDVPFGKIKLSVTFNKIMDTRFHSWLPSKTFVFPAAIKEPYYDKNKKSCYKDAILEPGMIYCIQFNSPYINKFKSMFKFNQNFRSKFGFKDAIPYTLIFATKSIDGKPTPIPQKYIDFYSKGKKSKKAVTKKNLIRPKIINTFPKCLKNDVDYGEITLSVEFNKPMLNNSWSWCRISKDMFPDKIEKPFFDKDQKTCKMKGILKPGNVYWIGLNSGRFRGFYDAEKKLTALPYILIFATKDKNGNPTPIPQKYINAANKVNNNQ